MFYSFPLRYFPNSSMKKAIKPQSADKQDISELEFHTSSVLISKYGITLDSYYAWKYGYS